MRLRVPAAIAIALMLFVHGELPSVAEETQIFARRGLGDRYTGVEATMSAHDPAMNCCEHFNAVGPVALVMKDLPGQPFVEAGNGKEWRPSQDRFRLHPYWSYNVTGGSNTTMGGFIFSIGLVPATYYKYTVWNIGGQQFRARICRGANWTLCDELGTAPFNRNYFSHTTVGGEGNCSDLNTDNNCPIGYIAADNNRFLWYTNNTWYSYCHTETYFDFNPNYSWSFNACTPGGPPRWTLHYR